METKNLDKKYCVGLGEILFDVLPSGSQLGGAPANFAYHAGQHGLHSVAVSAVGKDVLGDTALRILDEKKLKYVIPEVDYPTGTVQVQLDKEGVPTYDIKQGVAWDNIPFTDDIKEIAANAGAVCWGSLAQRSEVSRKTIYKFLLYSKRLSEDFRHQSPSKLLYSRSDYRELETLQCIED